jgi:hypothetical protein
LIKLIMPSAAREERQVEVTASRVRISFFMAWMDDEEIVFAGLRIDG